MNCGRRTCVGARHAVPASERSRRASFTTPAGIRVQWHSMPCLGWTPPVSAPWRAVGARCIVPGSIVPHTRQPGRCRARFSMRPSVRPAPALPPYTEGTPHAPPLAFRRGGRGVRFVFPLFCPAIRQFFSQPLSGILILSAIPLFRYCSLSTPRPSSLLTGVPNRVSPPCAAGRGRGRG